MERVIRLSAFFLIFNSVSVFAVTGKKFPEMVVQGIESGSLSPETVKGKVTVVNLWATWCEACKVELKEMEGVFAPLLKNPKFNFAMVSLDKDPEKAKTWISENLKNPKEAMKYLYKDPEFKFAEKFADETFPVTLVINQKGEVVHIHEGYDENSNQTEVIAKQVRELLPSGS